MTAFLALASQAALAQQLQVLPRDEAARDPAFLAFLTRLQEAIHSRDLAYIVAQSSSDVLVSFGGNGGHDELREFFLVPEENYADEYKHLAAETREENWATFEETLTLGGVFTAPGTFVTPYIFAYDFPEKYDVFGILVVTGTSVLMRQAPDRDAPVLARLNYAVVTGNEIDPVNGYAEVTLHDGAKGFVHVDYLRSPIDQRAIFRREDGEWKMEVLVAGD
ncbi:MAG: SH3 domain-containing protein [Rhodobacteraceae bacterium]|nr:SH3 domain-containing protein [Paracoccaceae bacterium]